MLVGLWQACAPCSLGPSGKKIDGDLKILSRWWRVLLRVVNVIDLPWMEGDGIWSSTCGPFTRGQGVFAGSLAAIDIHARAYQGRTSVSLKEILYICFILQLSSTRHPGPAELAVNGC